MTPLTVGVVAARAARSGAAAPACARISVVDDDSLVRHGLCCLLQDAGWFVDPFSCCEDFLEAHRLSPSACVVLDVHFPKMSGLALLRHMRDMADATPIIVVSGSSGINEAVRSMKKGAVDFIEKPVQHDRLIDSVVRALAMSRRSDAIATARDAALENLKGLTTRQKQVMALVLAGHPSKNIAADLGISQRTVESHRAAVMNRTGARSIPALARLVMSTQWSPDQ